MGVTAVDELLPVLADALGVDRVEPLAVRPLSAGASRLTSVLDVDADGTVHRLVLQRERTTDRARIDVATEVRLLRAAHAAGVPVPMVVAAGPSYLVTSHVDGETIPRRILRDPALATARSRFAADCGRILAGIASMAVETVAPIPTTDPVDALEQMLDRVGTPRPGLEFALHWLRMNRPPHGRTGVVHGDFRNGNLIVGPDGVRAVLDWELAHLGDPREDLGWLCARVWRFGAPAAVGGMGTLADLLDAYAQHGGDRVDPAGLFWWQVLATLRWGAICLEQARVHLSAEFRSVELAVIGRRAAEMEYELMRMLA
ncbi:phosphotransferase family protein [Virgisporangium aurantiacum]|uniref:Acyl-CoA dehydrogenase n=1 Tax=Virgisporangium aurantiacum TaxID=175570 RepID=A0A8J4DZN4_9ACTN|nr:phosphotransferase family protein [Virgisporangium aurantiacum]GIJ56920.1 acyl-CoA dehydrogenase [Virgisporangium aurantiacum]